MEQKWLDVKDGVKYITGMHFRDATYPIKVQRYPGSGSMVTDSQRMGVITGQFIRAQRLCNALRTFKEAVQNVALAAMRRGYKRRELDRMWGKFLVNWWKAEEMRRGELRSWFRKMTSRVHKTVQWENRGQEQDHQLGQRECKHGSRCLYKTSACPFAHPAIRVPSAPKGDQEMVPSEPAEGVPSAPEGTQSRAPSAPSEDVEVVPSETLQKEEGVPPAPGPRQQEEVRVPPVPGAWQQRGQLAPCGDRELVPKAQGKIWQAKGDGSCLFYCLAGSNAEVGAFWLRHALAHYVRHSWNEVLQGLDLTTGELLHHMGWGQSQYEQDVVRADHMGDELELILLSRITRQRLRVTQEKEDGWQQYAEYGTEGPVLRLQYKPEKLHYDVVEVREAWEREQQLIDQEAASAQARIGNPAQRRGGMAQDNEGCESERPQVKELVMEQGNERARMQKAARHSRSQKESRKLLLATNRQSAPEGAETDAELLANLAHDTCTYEQVQALGQVLGHEMPWNVLGLPRSATASDCRTAYRAMSLLVHPDRCHHPRAQEAFDNLGTAYEWSKDKAAWGVQRTLELRSAGLRMSFLRWVQAGRHL
jgi:hypothetical protein